MIDVLEWGALATLDDPKNYVAIFVEVVKEFERWLHIYSGPDLARYDELDELDDVAVIAFGKGPSV